MVGARGSGVLAQRVGEEFEAGGFVGSNLLEAAARKGGEAGVGEVLGGELCECAGMER